ncbi:MAG: FtsX-like permease family protein [Actinomycetota bacterium]|nr:FtsX-like permease family protein [Actinomycetota bacterium]
MKTWLLLLRWSWRDLRKYWVKVIAIALVIGIGTGAYAGLTSTANWRRQSNVASMELLNMYDLRFELGTDSSVPTGDLAAAAAAIDHATWISAVEERLVRPTQVDASTAGETIMVPGRIVGVDIADGGPGINGWYIESGSGLGAADIGESLVLLEHGFALQNDLPASGEITVSGGERLRYVGQAMTPEFYIVVPENSTTFALGTFAGVFTSLETAQSLTGMEGAVNDLVLTITDDADRDVVATEVKQAVSDLGVGVDVIAREDDPAYRLLFEDVENDQEFFNIFALLIFGGAVMGAFNLITRLAEAQRREIGISMALGVSPRKIALRPLLVGSQIALLGVVFGVGVGVLIGQLMRSVLTSFVPLPVWLTGFQWELFFWVAVVGFMVPFVAVAYPVWRAVRVRPIEAIRTGHLAARGGGLAPLIKRIHFPGDTFAQLPFRNLLRAPRRAVLTALGIAAVMAVLVGFLGSIDSFLGALDRGTSSIEGVSPDRMIVNLEGVLPIADPGVTAIEEAASVGDILPVMQVGARAHGVEDVDLLLEILDFDNDIWQPAVANGDLGEMGMGVILAKPAADDLGVGVGDTVSLTHPVRTGPASFGFAESQVVVAALHENPFRFAAYMDEPALEMVGAVGLANVVYANPGAGFDSSDVQRELFGLDAVASVQKASAAADDLDELMAQFVGILQAVAFVVLLLAVLMAFNSASISFEERQREHATMFAYGVRVRKALRMAVIENLVIGIVATIIGFAGGLWMLWWVVNVTAAETMPDIGLIVELSPVTLFTVIGLGIAAVALAPVFTIRRMRRMDLPGTLRVME